MKGGSTMNKKFRLMLSIILFIGLQCTNNYIHIHDDQCGNQGVDCTHYCLKPPVRIDEHFPY